MAILRLGGRSILREAGLKVHFGPPIYHSFRGGETRHRAGRQWMDLLETSFRAALGSLRLTAVDN